MRIIACFTLVVTFFAGSPTEASEAGLSSPVTTPSGQGQHGAVSKGAGDGSGIVAEGLYGGVFYGAASGAAAKGGPGFPGVEAWAGTDATRQAHQAAAIMKNGNLVLEGPNQYSWVPFKNTVAPNNLIKAWGSFETNGDGAVTVRNGFNISSVFPVGYELRVTFAHAFADTAYVCNFVASSAVIPVVGWKGDGNIGVRFVTLSSGVLNPATTPIAIDMICTGNQ